MSATGPEFGNCKVLIIEDDDDISGLIQDVLPNEIQLVCAQNLEKARTCLSQNKFDFILLDRGLPDGDGLQLCSNLQDQNHKDTPLMMITARGEIDDKLEAFSNGAIDYLVKPFDLRELRARVVNHLRQA